MGGGTTFGRNKTLRKKRSRKLVVTYDEKAREQFLTGFRKRKQMRRVEHFEKTMAKRDRDLKSKRKALRQEKKEKVQAKAEASGLLELEEQIAGEEALLEDANVSKETAKFHDDFTSNAFGGGATVEVTTCFGFGSSSDDDGGGGDDEIAVKYDMVNGRPRKRQKHNEGDVWASDDEDLLESLRKKYDISAPAAGDAQQAPAMKSFVQQPKKRKRGCAGRGRGAVRGWQADKKTRKGAKGWKSARAKGGRRAKGKR